MAWVWVESSEPFGVLSELYGGYIGIMEPKIETTLLYGVYKGCIHIYIYTYVLQPAAMKLLQLAPVHTASYMLVWDPVSFC